MNLNRRSLAVIAVLSGLATALVVHVGLAQTTAQRDALAAVRRPETITAVQQADTLLAVAAPTQRPARNVRPPATDTTPAATTRRSTTTPTATTPAAATTTGTTSTTTTPTDVGLPKVGHVFLVSLSSSSLTAAFGKRSPATYLHSLVSSGTLLSGYRSLGHGELADEVAMLSGQAPNRDTTAGCPRYVAFPPSATANSAGLIGGTGCVYPDTTLTLADQVQNAGKQWGGYVDGMGTTPCPTPQTGGKEDAAIATAEADYDTLHNPFIFFPSLTGSGQCYLSEADTARLAPVLQRTATATPELTYLAPNACADGARPAMAGIDSTAASITTTTTTTPATSPGAGSTTAAGSAPSATAGSTTTAGAVTPTTGATTPTTGPATTTGAVTPTAGATTATTATAATAATTESATTAGRDDYCAPGDARGLTAEDDFLRAWVPQILASRAFTANGVLVISFSGVAPAHGHRRFATGALVISRWTAEGRRIATAYDPYALLHSIEDMLDLQPLGHAATAPAFAKRVLRAS